MISGSASESAANTEANAANNASALQLQMFEQTEQNEAPFLQAGTGALPFLQAGIGTGGGNVTGTGPLNAPFTLADFKNSPGYEFQMNQGENAILNSASATGGVKSGNTLKGLTSYGEGVANQDYWNAYNAYVNAQNQKFDQLQTVAGSGQNAAGNLGALSSQVGQSVGNNIVGAGNASAAGTIGLANAAGSGLNGLSSTAMLYQILNNNSGFNPQSGGNGWYGDASFTNP